jgi:hypothetical protein
LQDANMLKKLNSFDMLKSINAGIALHNVDQALTTSLYSAEDYFAAGYCELKMAEGAAIIEALPVRDQKLIRHLAERTLEGDKHGFMMALKPGPQIVLEENGSSRRLVSTDFQVIAEINGSGYDAPCIIQLSDGFKVSGQTLLAHAEVNGEQRYLIKQRTPVEMICCAIGLIKERLW